MYRRQSLRIAWADFCAACKGTFRAAGKRVKVLLGIDSVSYPSRTGGRLGSPSEQAQHDGRKADNAKGTKRTTAPGRRRRLRRDGCQDRNRRNRRDAGAVRQDSERPSRRKGSRKKTDTTGTQPDSKKSGRGQVGQLTNSKISKLRLRPNKRRILEAVLFLISEAEKTHQYLTQYEIVKTLFLADEAHINKFGRPITFDNYVAMKNGPVPSWAYNMLKLNFQGKSEFGEDWPLWKREISPRDGPNAYKFHSLRRKPNLNVLSESDCAELTNCLTIMKSLAFGGVQDYTHMKPAYKKAWESRGDKGSNNIDYSTLFGLDNEDLFINIVYASKHM